MNRTTDRRDGPGLASMTGFGTASAENAVARSFFMPVPPNRQRGRRLFSILTRTVYCGSTISWMGARAFCETNW